MAVNFPINTDSMVAYGGDVPTTDAADLDGLTPSMVSFKSVGNAAPGDYDQPSPCEIVSLPTKAVDAPPLGAFLLTNLHDDDWLDPTKPHISPESQKG